MKLPEIKLPDLLGLALKPITERLDRLEQRVSVIHEAVVSNPPSANTGAAGPTGFLTGQEESTIPGQKPASH